MGVPECLLTAVLIAETGEEPPIVVRSSEVAVVRSADGLARMRIYYDSEETPEAPAYLGVASFEPGAEVVEHAHTRDIELLYLLKGELRVTVEGKDYRVRAGDAVRIPARLRHSFCNAGSETVELVESFVRARGEPELRARPAAEPGEPGGPGGPSRLPGR